jgi:hypothetical protein
MRHEYALFNVKLSTETIFSRSGLKINYIEKNNTVIAIPLQAWTGPGGSRRFRLPDFKTIGA